MTEQEKKLCKDFVNIWLNGHKDDVEIFTAQRDALIAEKMNEYGSNKDQTLRHALELPTDLARKLSNNFPIIFQDKKALYWFMKEFKIFCIPKKI